MYDYYTNEKEDIEDFIDSNIDFGNFETMGDLEDYLNDILFCEDCITGNGSGSYTHSKAKAAEYLIDNTDILADAFEECGNGEEILREGVEACDVTIRCYILGECINDVLPLYEVEFAAAH